MYLDATENKLHQGKNVPIHKDVYTNGAQQRKIIYLRPKTFLWMMFDLSFMSEFSRRMYPYVFSFSH